MEPNDRTSTGEESSRRGRPPVRLAAKPARLGATGRLGGEVASARVPARVLRAATRLSTPSPGAASEPAPEAEIARSPAEPPPLPPAPSAPAVSDTPVGMEDWQAAWIFGGDAGKAIALSEESVAREAANPGQSGRRTKLQRSRGARIVEGRASGVPEPTPPSGSVARQTAEPTLPPIPGADIPETPPAARKRVARSPAGSARSEPVPDSPMPSVQPPSIMRSASPVQPATPRGVERSGDEARGRGSVPGSDGERPAPVRMALRRRETAPPAAAVRPRMQPAARGSVHRPAASAPAPVADIVVAPPAERGVFRRAIDALTGRGPASVDINAPAAGDALAPAASEAGTSAEATAPTPPSVSGPQSSAAPSPRVSGPQSGRISRTPVSGPRSSASPAPPVSGPRSSAAPSAPVSGPGTSIQIPAPVEPPRSSAPAPEPVYGPDSGGAAVSRTPITGPRSAAAPAPPVSGPQSSAAPAAPVQGPQSSAAPAAPVPGPQS
ncbi:MAG: hypothetical protein ABI611_19310, partial [Solirubrobacteraceae bacterium]